MGLTRGTTAAHLARSAIEGIAHQVTDVLKAMEVDASIPIAEIRVDGGAVTNNLLMQFQSDIMHVPVIRPQVTELTAFGAAFLAGLSVGLWKNIEEVGSYWKQDCRFTPTMAENKVLELRRKWKKAIECAQTWEEQ